MLKTLLLDVMTEASRVLIHDIQLSVHHVLPYQKVCVPLQTCSSPPPEPYKPAIDPTIQIEDHRE